MYDSDNPQPQPNKIFDAHEVTINMKFMTYVPGVLNSNAPSIIKFIKDMRFVFHIS